MVIATIIIFLALSLFKLGIFWVLKNILLKKSFLIITIITFWNIEKFIIVINIHFVKWNFNTKKVIYITKV